jgi:hypothetical protein
VPKKFRFPYYKKLNWYALSKFDEDDGNEDLVASMMALAQWLLLSCQQSKRRLSVIPKEIKHPVALAERVLAKATALDGKRSFKRKRSL